MNTPHETNVNFKQQLALEINIQFLVKITLFKF